MDDAAYDSNTNLNWKRIKELCTIHNIEFKNQTFVQFIKQLRDNFIKEQSDRNNFSTIDRKNYFKNIITNAQFVNVSLMNLR